MNEYPFFIGYETLENWQKSATSKTAYAMPIETTQTAPTIMTSELAVMVSQIDGPLVHYVKIILATLTYANGEYLGDSADEKRQRTRPEQAFDIIHTWLLEQGYTVIRAAVAIPADIRLIDGWADFLAYDKTGQRLFRRQPTV